MLHLFANEEMSVVREKNSLASASANSMFTCLLGSNIVSYPSFHGSNGDEQLYPT